MNEFNRNNLSLCEDICVFKGYIDNNIICECDIKIKFNSFMNVNVSKYNLIHRFSSEELKNYSKNNIWVVKCFLFLLSKELFSNNIGSQIILGIILFFIIGAIIFYAKEKKILYNKIKALIDLFYFEKEKNILDKEGDNKLGTKNNNHKNNKNRNNNDDSKNKNNKAVNDNGVDDERILFPRRNAFKRKINKNSKTFQNTSSKSNFIGNIRNNRINNIKFFNILETRKDEKIIYSLDN